MDAGLLLSGSFPSLGLCEGLASLKGRVPSYSQFEVSATNPCVAIPGSMPLPLPPPAARWSPALANCAAR